MVSTAALPSCLPVVSEGEKAIGLSNLGFLTVLNESNGYLGGYLVTNVWGRPLEFRLSSAVQPNRVQQILYAGTLEPYVCGELIGKTLVSKAAVPVQLIVTDSVAVLELRSKVECPVLWLNANKEPPREPSEPIIPNDAPNRPSFSAHPRFPEDARLAPGLLAQLDKTFDLTEPFLRIREAIGEARKLGVHK